VASYPVSTRLQIGAKWDANDKINHVPTGRPQWTAKLELQQIKMGSENRRLGVDYHMEHRGMPCSVMEYPGMQWNIAECNGITWTIMEYHEISWNIMEYHKILSNTMEYRGILWNIKKRHRISWNDAKPFRASQVPQKKLGLQMLQMWPGCLTNA
jgi:hypothetical protein